MTEAEEIISLTARNADLKAQIRQLKAYNAEKNERIGEKDDEIAKLEQDNSNLERRNAELERMKNLATEAMFQAIQTIEGADKSLTALRSCNAATISICEFMLRGLREGSIISHTFRSTQFRRLEEVLPGLGKGVNPDKVTLEQLLDMHIRVIRPLS
jgi:septal ring factor EnvC (AmiA/AmiB activator)